MDLSGPRARLYMPVDKVVAACGKGGSLGEVPHQYEKPWPKVGRGVASKVERFPQPKAIRSRMPAPAPPPPRPPLHHQRPVGPVLLRPPAPTMYRPNRPPRFQPRFPVEKKINKLPSGVVAHKSVIPSGNSGAAVHNKYPPLPSEKGDFQHVLSKVKAAEEDLLDQPKEHGDLLSQLEEAVVESLGAGKEMIAKAVADSWRPQVCPKLTRLICFCSIMSFQVEDLKEIHGKVLSSQDSATKEATAVRRALAGVYQVPCLLL